MQTSESMLKSRGTSLPEMEEEIERINFEVYFKINASKLGYETSHKNKFI